MNLELMDPNVQNVILGIVANSITSMLGQAGQKAYKLIVGEKEQKVDLQALLKRSINEVAETIQWPGPGRLEEVCLFLCSPEVEEYIRQIYAVQLLETSPNCNHKAIEQHFATSFSAYVGIPEEKIEQAAGLLFNALVGGCEKVLEKSIECGVLTAHEARSNLRFRVLRDEIVAIQRNIDFLKTAGHLNLQAIQKFEEKYRHQVATRHKHLIPPHFDSALKIPIDSIIVPPSFTAALQKKGEEPRTLSTLDFLSEAYRAVILGNPGGGKSTFSIKVCHDLSDQYSQRLFAGRLVTPILVILRDYGATKKNRNTSILDFIETTANSIYQIKPPAGAFEYMLLNGRALVFFDGLDELLDTAYRQEISSDIESFCELYPAVPVLVTSREVGYEQAPLDKQMFDILRLAPFNDEQVEDYVQKWFNTDSELTPSQRKTKARGFLNESSIVTDLRSNPLMLGLMCSIYRGDNYIPKNRPDVYEKCAIMLFERWDKSRGISVPLPFEVHIRPAMMYLAYWIYEDDSLQGGVTEKKLVARAADYLEQHRFDDRMEAEHAAQQFIEFCRGRAWVFTDTGTTKTGERLFQFTHRTFLEYFAAAHLVRLNPMAEALNKVLIPRIERREWDVVAQLAFQILNRNVEGGGDDLLTILVQSALKAEETRTWNLISFSVRCLEFIIPSPKVAKFVAGTFLELYLEWGKGRLNEERLKTRPDNLRFEPEDVLLSLLNCAAENRPILAACLETLVIRRVSEGVDEGVSSLALELGWHFTLALHHIKYRFGLPSSETELFWQGVSVRLQQQCCSKALELAPKRLWVCVDLFCQEQISLQQMLDWHGFDGLFRNQSYALFPNTISWSLGSALVYTFLRNNDTNYDKDRYAKASRALRELGAAILSERSLIMSSADIVDNHIFRLYQQTPLFSQKFIASPSPEVSFGIFCVVAVILEAASLQKHWRLPEQEVEKVARAFPVPVIRLLLLRRLLNTGSLQEIETVVTEASFTKEQSDFATHWALKDFSLVSA